LTDDIFWIDEGDLDRFQRKKKRRIHAVREMLKRLKRTSLKEFIAKVAITCGIHERTLREYLNALETIGEITIKDGTIIYNEAS